MTSAVLIPVLLLFVALTLMSVLCTTYIVLIRRSGARTQRKLPWSTMGLASRQRTRILDITAMPQPPAPSYRGPGLVHERTTSTSSMRVAYQQRDGSWAFAGPLDPFVPSLLVSPRSTSFRSTSPTFSMSRHHEKKLSELGSITLDMDILPPPPSYSQVERSPLSPRYSFTVRDQRRSSEVPLPPSLARSPPMAYSEIERSSLIEAPSLPSLSPVSPLWPLSDRAMV
ncbi:hypothetical protein PENSPDRAFT_735175 [Peniophora sp. CONT]|nr:hypothetical protein PENSPDRAFT_735175 [Peniophora sp. CONT]